MAILEIETRPGAHHGAQAPLPRLMESICLTLVIGEAVFLAGSFFAGTWLIAPDGGNVASDFVDVWAAGYLALGGHAATAYHWPTHKVVEASALGHGFDGYYGWHYPPVFLFVAVALAALPYTLSFLVWTISTFLTYLAAIRAIIGERSGYLLAAAFPPVLANFFVGQNGFLSTALIGGTLILLERRQAVLAGILLGLLTYKPHLGLLFPIALAAGGEWRTIAAAAITALLIALASYLVFGDASWLAFIEHIGESSQTILAEGKAGWSKLQTAFGLVRTLGGSEALALTVQAVVGLAAASAIALLWRSRAPYEIKAAALGTGSLLATPYLYTYDLLILAVPLAYLLRLGRAQGFLPHELPVIGVACLLILSFILPIVNVPVGFIAVLLVAALIAHRALALRSAAA
jgi:arabinofuranan 3-O-arabinosyltransferase